MDNRFILVNDDEELALADRFPAIANDVLDACIVDSEKIDGVIEAILNRTAAIYGDGGRLDAVQPFPLPKPLSCDAANELAAYVKANAFESFLSGALNC